MPQDKNNKVKPLAITDYLEYQRRLKAYQDSLSSYNNGQIENKLVKNFFLSGSKSITDLENFYNEKGIGGRGRKNYPVNEKLDNKKINEINGITKEGYKVSKWQFQKPVQPVVYQAKDKIKDSFYDGHWKDKDGNYWAKDPMAKDYKAEPIIKPKINLTKAPILPANLSTNSQVKPNLTPRQTTKPLLPIDNIVHYTSAGYPMINNQTVPEGYRNKPGNQANKLNSEIKYEQGGKVIPQYGNGGQIGSMIGTGLGIAAGAIIPGAQPLIPVLASAGGQLGSFVGGQIDNKIEQNHQPQVQQSYASPIIPNTPQYANGGQVNQQMINVEGQELEVDTNGNVVKDFKNKPLHPISGINPDGNIMAKEGNTIIPVKHRNKYLKGDKNTRLGLINQLSILQKAREATQKYDSGGPV